MVLDYDQRWLIQSCRVVWPHRLENSNILPYVFQALWLLYQNYFNIPAVA